MEYAGIGGVIVLALKLVLPVVGFIVWLLAGPRGAASTV